MKASSRPFLARPLGLVLALGVAPFAHADEAEVKKSMEAFIGAPAVESVVRTEYGNLYEVVLKNGQLVYTDAKNSFIIDGSIIDTATRRDVTQARMNQLAAIDFSQLPLQQAVKVVRGNGTRVIATFEDPNCGYCKRFERDLTKIDNVTVHVFLYPILSQDSVDKSRNIWCAKDKGKTFLDWMVKDVTPAAANSDTAALARNLEFGKKNRITGTPTLIFANGTRVPGAIGADRVEKLLAEAK